MADDTDRSRLEPKDFVRLDGSEEPKGRQHPSRARVVIVAALVACSVLMFTVSLGFVHPDESGGWSIAWLFPDHDPLQTVESGSAVASDRPSEQTPEGAGSGEEPVAVDSASDGTGLDKPQAAADDSGAVAVQPAPGAVSQAHKEETPSEAPSEPVPEQAPAQPQAITVNVSVSSDAVGGPVASSGSCTLSIGATPYDALRALGLSVSSRTSPFGVYVSAIGGLAEKDHGPKSGWMYAVNGVSPNTSCSSYKLQDGDTVSWYYVK